MNEEVEEWKWRGVGILSVFLSIQDLRDSLKLGPGSRPGQDMSYHDNDLPSLRNINTHQQTSELQTEETWVSERRDWNIHRGPATEHGFFRRLRVTNDNPFIFLFRPPQTESLMVMSRHFYILTFLRVHHGALTLRPAHRDPHRSCLRNMRMAHALIVWL